MGENTATINEDTRVSREQLYEEVWAERLALARKMVDTTDALRWLAAWKTPEER